MAKENEMKATASFDAAAFIKGANQVINALASVEGQSKQTQKEIDKAEKRLVNWAKVATEAGSAAKTSAASIKDLNTALAKMGATNAALGRAKNNFGVAPGLESRTALIMQRVNEQQRENIRLQKEALATYAPNIRATKALGEAEKQRATDARAANKQMITDAQKTRQQELTELRSAIQGRYAVEDRANRVRVADAQRSARQAEATERQTQRAQTALVRQAARERDAIYNQSAKAQLQHAAEAQRQGLNYGDQTMDGGLANSRYALYDVATTLGAISAALLGVAAASVKVGVNYQEAFAQVQRTTGLTGKSLESLQRQLLDLSTQLPSSFEEISSVAALGGQLNIADSALDDFTKTVIMFGSTSNVSLDQSATALARLAQITNSFTEDGSNAYNKLASAILKTGVNSIATESQIVAIATQIGTAGDLAGFSADQIIGLSSAFASLNVAPERARGTVQRVFGSITAAVDGGGEALDNFAKVSGTTADQFADKWKTDAKGAFVDLINGLQGAQAAGQDTNAMLKLLGIGAVRDIQALQALANNTNVLNDAFKDSASGYKDGTELQKQYAITASTLAARFTQLGSTFKTIINEMQGGALSAIAGVVDIFQDLAETLYKLAQTPALATIGSIVLAGAALVGTLAAVRAAGALATASLFALTQAEAALGARGLQTTGSVNALSFALGKLFVGTARAEAAQIAYNRALDQGRGKIYAMTAATGALATAGNGAAAALKSLAFAGAGIFALTAAVQLISTYAQKQQEAKANVDALTTSLNQQTAAITGTTRAAAFDILVKDGTIDRAKKLGLNLEMVTDAALGNADAMAQIEARDAALNTQYKESLKTNGRYAETTQEILKRMVDLDHVQESLGVSNKNLKKAIQEVRDAQAAGVETTKEAADGVDDLGVSLEQTIADSGSYVSGTLAMQNATYALGQSIAENGKVIDFSTNASRLNFTALQATVSAMTQAAGGDSAALATSLAGLMSSLVAFGIKSVDALNYVRQALAATGTPVDTLNFDNLKASAIETGNALTGGYSAGMAKATKSTNAAGAAAAKTAKEVRTLTDYANDLRTVTERAFELRFEVETAKDALDQAWADAKEGLKEEAKKDPFSFADFFDKKTYKQAGKDAILTAFRELKDEAAETAQKVKDAAQKVKDAMADMLGLKADKSVLEYQLKIAEKYGDTLRAQQIQAELAQNAADQAKATSDLAQAQTDAQQAAQDQNKTLKGNSQAAVNNRNKVRGLLGTYTDYIQSLIDGGASQETINKAIEQSKKDFRAQGIALGYSGQELDDYVDILSGMKKGYNNYTSEQKKATDGTKSKAQADRDAREAMRDLTQAQEDYIQSLIDSGAPQSVVRDAIAKGKETLRKQGVQLGLTKGKADKYADSLDDITTAMKTVPKNLSIHTNLAPAKRALAEWKAKKTATIHAKIKSPSGGFQVSGNVVPKNKKLTMQQVIAALLSVNKVTAHKFSVGGSNTSATAIQAKGGLTPEFHATGGVHGLHPGKPQGTDTTPAWLTPGEFVQKKSAVDYYGVPFMTALNNMQIPKYLTNGSVPASGGGSATGVMMVELSPVDRQLLAAVGHVTLVANGKVLASVTNDANANATTRNIA